MSFKITLRAARNNLVMTRKEAAEKFQIHYETLTKYEYDSSRVPRSFFTKIESVYGIPIDFIFFGIEKDFVEDMKNSLRLKQEA